jgi:hypothetical protein
MIFVPDSGADVAEPSAVKKNDIFYRKIASIKSPLRSFVIKRKLIFKAKHSRNMARGPVTMLAIYPVRITSLRYKGLFLCD